MSHVNYLAIVILILAILCFVVRLAIPKMAHAVTHRRSQIGRQTGFTLIELVVVIVILGILSATAIPRFTGMAKDARVASLNAMLAALESANTIVYGQAMVKNLLAATGTITMEGTAVSLVFGYPAAASGGINNALSAFSGFTFTTGSPSTFDLASATTPSTCRITYTQATSATAPSDVVITSTAGC